MNWTVRVSMMLVLTQATCTMASMHAHVTRASGGGQKFAALHVWHGRLQVTRRLRLFLRCAVSLCDISGAHCI